MAAQTILPSQDNMKACLPSFPSVLPLEVLEVNWKLHRQVPVCCRSCIHVSYAHSRPYKKFIEFSQSYCDGQSLDKPFFKKIKVWFLSPSDVTLDCIHETLAPKVTGPAAVANIRLPPMKKL